MAGDAHPKPEPRRRTRKRLRARPVVDVHLLDDDERAALDRRTLRDQAIYDAGQAAIERDRGRCRGRGLVAHDCTDRQGVDPQHIIPRSVRRDLADDPDNIIAVCRVLHRWIDANPAAARALGLHGYSYDRP